MVSDKPPRRSRSGKTPVTLDLAAEEKAAIAEPVRANDTDATTDASQPDQNPEAGQAPAGAAQSAPAAGDAAAPDKEPVTVEAQPGEEVSDGASAKASPQSSDLPTEPQTASPTAEPTSPFGPKKENEPETASSHPTEPPAATTSSRPVKQSPATSSMVAAGIVGGLVSLLLAGSMQYAGILPSLTQERSNSSADIESLRQQMATLQKAGPSQDVVARLEALEQGSGNGGGDLAQQVQALQQDLENVKSASAAMGDNSAQLGQKLQALEQRINQPGREQAIARALAAAGLKAATDRGGSFAAELETYSSVAADDPSLAKLQAYAEKGVPTRAELVRRFPAAANAMIDAIHQPTENEGIASRLLSSAMRVVKVRPVGEAEGDTPEARIARIEERIKNGNLKAAVSEWDGLPEAARTAAADYRQALDARIEVDDLAANTLTRAMAASGTKG
ncbi:hypothetical protein ACFSE1_13100 [Rhizobium helianthi]|uniref:Mitochondrial inner membrane protein n=1 Tax=Rhizobium helianthi TaxID=1132695 RepID=A0ABW4M5F1_9HYPH